MVTFCMSNIVKVLEQRLQGKAQRSQLECSPRPVKEPVNCRHILASSDLLIATLKFIHA